MEHSENSNKLGRKAKGLYQSSLTAAPIRRTIIYEGSLMLFMD